MRIGLTTEQFIEKSKQIHGNKYDYSKTIFKTLDKKVIIIFNNKAYLQYAKSHLNGYCPESNDIDTRTKYFIEKARRIHGDRYDYSQCSYTKMQDKVKIIYKGITYTQCAKLHLKGYLPEIVYRKYYTTDEFICKSKEIFGDGKYDYSLTTFKNVRTKVKIIFNGIIYEQCPRQHLYGNCVENGKSKGVIKISDYLDKNNIKYINEYKFTDCKNIRRLPYDFYLPDLNTLIEFDGEHHFQPIKIFGGDKSFKRILINDNIKNEYARIKNIHLIRISFKEIQQIENILSASIK